MSGDRYVDRRIGNEVVVERQICMLRQSRAVIRAISDRYQRGPLGAGPSPEFGDFCEAAKKRMMVPRRRSKQRLSKGRRCTVLIPALFLSFYGAGCLGQPEDPEASELNPSIEILALSRGRGVPEETRAALESMKSVVARLQREGSVIASDESVIGLEGETRLCVVFKDLAAARVTQSEFTMIAAAIDLLQVRNVVCKPK